MNILELKVNYYKSGDIIIKNAIILFVAFITACGGSSNSASGSSNQPGVNNNPGQGAQEEAYFNPYTFSGYFNNTRGETQTTAEFNSEQEEKLSEISEAKVIKEINRRSYEADTGYATFRLEFGYKDNELFNGPSYQIQSSTTTLSSGGISLVSSSYTDMVFVNESEEFSLYSSDSLFSCENRYMTEYSLYKTTMCEVNVMVDREKLNDYNFHMVLDVNVTTLEGYSNRSSISTSPISSSARTNKHLPINQLNSISIMDRDTQTIFGTFYPL